MRSNAVAAKVSKGDAAALEALAAEVARLRAENAELLALMESGRAPATVRSTPSR